MNLPDKPTSGPPRQTTSPQRAVLFRALAVLLPILFLECAARLYWAFFVFAPATQQSIAQAQAWHGNTSDERIPYTFPKNAEMHVAGTLTRTNNLGLRNSDDVQPAAPESAIRIICIGDSVTFGYTVSGNEQAYPAVLQARLQDGGIDCQVINAGMPRFRIRHLVNLYEKHLAELQPEIVVLLGGWNDLNDNVLLPAEPGFDVLDWLNQHCYLIKVVRHWSVVPRLGPARREPARIDAGGLARFEQSLREMAEAAADSGAVCVLCSLPHFYEHLESPRSREMLIRFFPRGTPEQIAEATSEMNKRIGAVAQQLDVPLIDLSQVDRRSLFADAVHPNDEGSARIAEAVAEYLVSHLIAR